MTGNCLKRLFQRRARPEQADGSGAGNSAVHPGAEPAQLHRGRRRLKESFTSHWDLDYLPREEVERLLRDEDQGTSD